MTKLSEFLDYLLEQVKNKSIYCWGAQGQLLSSIDESWIRNKETSTSNANKVIKLWKERKGVSGARAFDCSGLGCYFLYNLKQLIKSDMTADGLYKNVCVKIDKDILKKGDFVFKANILGKCTHIGYVVDDELNVVEARGRAYGVVKRPLSEGGWNRYGRPNIAWEKEPEPAVFVLTRLLKKGVRGNDVKWVQTRLNYCGYNCGTVDGVFGSKTQAAVKSFQKNSGLTVDGIVGNDTITKLGGRWWK